MYCQQYPKTVKDIESQYKKNISKYPTPNDIEKLKELITASDKIDYKEGAIKGKMILLNIYNELSDYKTSLALIKEIESSDSVGNGRMSSLSIFKSNINKAMGLDKEALKNLQKALQYAKSVSDPDGRHIKSAQVYANLALYYDSKSPNALLSNLQKELYELKQLSEKTSEEKITKYTKIVLNNINIGNYYLGVVKPMRLDLAEPYYLGVYSYKTSQPIVFENNAMNILKGVGRFYLEKGDYHKTIEMANEILVREKQNRNPTHRLFGFQLLADSNEELKNSKEQAKYTLLYAKLNDSLNLIAKKEVGKEVDQLITTVKKEKDNEHNSNLKTILLLVGGFIIIFTLSIWWYWRNKNRKLKIKYHEVIKKLNEESDLSDTSLEIDEINSETETEAKAPIKISEDKVKIVLARMNRFEKSKKFLKKDISLPWLANYANVNTKYLSQIIRNEKDNNFNGYINQLRINYILRKLYESPVYREYKISYLAEECGFASAQVFVIAFKKETDLTPSYFIQNLNAESIA
ncbi:hypothetical protein GCM10023210_17940 [Chryseobacterium ginsengisoli]|uniref:HTH araC/xylS-type domain-containing protein n=1 Tax=Chryseobacterium ginsengisoli TaxID=363853 RepID=A0ABP9M4R0_9FLAO